MSSLVTVGPRITAMGPSALAKIQVLEDELKKLPQLDLETTHIIHGGIYSRTIMLPAGYALTGALIEVPTMVIVHGDAAVYANDDVLNLSGYNIIPASKGRKQAFVAVSDTIITMMFPTTAKTVEDAEREFTKDADELMSRSSSAKNHITITGE